MAATTWLDQAKARHQELLPGLPRERQGLKHLGHPLWLSQVHSQGAGPEVEQPGLELACPHYRRRLSLLCHNTGPVGLPPGPLTAAFPGALAGSGMGSRAARTRTGSRGMQVRHEAGPSVSEYLPFRYQPDQNIRESEKTGGQELEMKPGQPEALAPEGTSDAGSSKTLSSQCSPGDPGPSLKSGQAVYGCASVLVLLLAAFSLMLAQWPGRLFSGDPVCTSVAALLLLLVLGLTLVVWRQPQNATPLYFKAPALPVLPLVSIFVNLYLMMQMAGRTWAQFAVWMAIGFAIYFGYGIRHSLEEKNDRQPPDSSPQAPGESSPDTEVV